MVRVMGTDTYEQLSEAPAIADAVSAAPAPASALEADLRLLLQTTGDAIALTFVQMLAGRWRDDHGHDVALNAGMVGLADVLRQIMRFREVHLGYTPVPPRDPRPEVAA